MAYSRVQALGLFRRLLRAREATFRGDVEALSASRTKIYEEFRKNSDESDPTALSSLYETGEGVIDVLHDNVLQAKLNESTGRYQLKMTKSFQTEEMPKTCGSS
eukprot:m.527677 g.527677  ORF g.527677 m.527677 type:complete len:104 (+) comp22013_c0_seq3:176-487(+)